MASQRKAQRRSWAGLTPAWGSAGQVACREWASDLLAGPQATTIPRTKATGESHLSGFLESGHTRNCSSAGWKVPGCPALSLWSAQDLAPGTCRHLRTTADGARGLRSAGASLPHVALSMAALTAFGTAQLSPAPSRRVTLARLHPLYQAPPPVLRCLRLQHS